MSVRGGQGPREPMAGPATRVAAGAGTATSAPDGTVGDRATSAASRTTAIGRGLGGLVRFVLFLVIMAVVVLVVMVTVARPVLRMVVVPWADGNPGALRIGFVADLVREDLGDALTTPASTDPTAVEFVVESRRHARDARAAARGGRDHHQPARVPVRGAA